MLRLCSKHLPVQIHKDVWVTLLVQSVADKVHNTFLFACASTGMPYMRSKWLHAIYTLQHATNVIYTLQHATNVLDSKQAMVMGPTPPGTGVIAFTLEKTSE